MWNALEPDQSLKWMFLKRKSRMKKFGTTFLIHFHMQEHMHFVCTMNYVPLCMLVTNPTCKFPKIQNTLSYSFFHLIKLYSILNKVNIHSRCPTLHNNCRKKLIQHLNLNVKMQFNDTYVWELKVL